MKNHLKNNSGKMTNQLLVIILMIGLTISCSDRLKSYSKKRNTIKAYQLINDSTLALIGVSENKKYGYSKEYPIQLGVYDVMQGGENIEKYLNALLDSTGKGISYARLKPCCPFKTKNFVRTVRQGIYDGKYGMLEKYQVKKTNGSQNEVIILFFNLYDETNKMLAPNGFLFKK